MLKKPHLFIFFGMIATGKSTLAAAYAKMSGCSYYNSDIVRKELAGLAPSSRQTMGVDAGIYSNEFSRRTYDALLSRAFDDLRKGVCVVLDGSYQSRNERMRVCQEFGKQNRLLFIYCQCPETIMKKRMEARLKNPRAVSDGRWEIYLQQKERFEMPVELSSDRLLYLNTDSPLLALLHQLEERIHKGD
jgi:uncharacterized protein